MIFMDENISTNETSEQVKKVPNPTGIGGFQKGQSGNPGGRPKNQESFTYWMNFFKNMSVEDFKEYEATHSEKEMTVAEGLAYARLAGARHSLKEFKEVADRTEGKPTQRTEISGLNGDAINISLVEIVGSEYNENGDKIS